MRSITRCFALAFLLVFSLFPASPAAAGDHGQPQWFDLITEDTRSAASFYQGLFGWEIDPSATDVRLVSHAGRDIARLIKINDEMPGQPEAQWLVGVVVDDLPKAVGAARTSGGTILRDLTEVKGSGSYAVIKDPQGAILILGTPTRDIGGPRIDGGFAWVELWTNDLEAAADFYGQVIGYSRNTVEGPDGSYTVFETDGKPRAGLVATPNEEARPIWAPYIGVADLTATLKRTTELGGEIILPPRPDFGGGRVALIKDPSHAMIFVAQLKAEKENTQ